MQMPFAHHAINPEDPATILDQREVQTPLLHQKTPEQKDLTEYVTVKKECGRCVQSLPPIARTTPFPARLGLAGEDQSCCSSASSRSCPNLRSIV